MKLTSIKKISTMAVLAVVALVIFVLESYVPSPFPGLKPGLANIITLFMLFLGNNWNARDIFLVLLTRIILAAFITGQAVVFIYGLSGGITALFVMIILKKLFNDMPIPVISVAGAVSHNLGQITAAAFVLQSKKAFFYLPILVAGGIASGLLTGFSVYFLFKLRPRFILYIKGEKNDF